MVWIQWSFPVATASTCLFLLLFWKNVLSHLNLPNSDDDGYGNGAGTCENDQDGEDDNLYFPSANCVPGSLHIIFNPWSLLRREIEASQIYRWEYWDWVWSDKESET